MTTAAELEDEIARDPEDPAPYLVYADWLSERDDLRGELHRRESAARSARARASNPRRASRDVDGPRRARCEDRRAPARSANDRDGRSRRALADALLPPAAHLEPRLVSLAVLQHPRLAQAHPQLTHLHCDATAVDLDELAFPNLEYFGIASNGLTYENIESICSANLPKLVSLDFWGVREPWQDDMADDPTTFTDALWQRLLDAEGVPALRDLTFSSTGFGDQLVDALIGSRLLRSLDKLAIDDTELTELGYQRMRDNIDAFQHLDLKLSTSTTYPEARAQVIEAYWASQARRTY